MRAGRSVDPSTTARTDSSAPPTAAARRRRRRATVDARRPRPRRGAHSSLRSRGSSRAWRVDAAARRFDLRLAIAIGLLKMLLELATSKKSGAVDASAHGARVRVFVENGDIVFAEEGGVGETLGRILVRERVLSEDQYGAAIEWTAD